MYKIYSKDNLAICTSENINLMTPYVLLEQEDWYEEETSFVRRFIQPGMNILDIGACFGVYGLPMAKLTGPKGRVYAFEPGSIARKYLEESKKENALDNLQIFAQGLSNKSGQANINLAYTPELNKIEDQTDCEAENVELTTLDNWWQETGQPDIQLFKLDVNGMEDLVIQGGERLLTETSPVVIFSTGQGDASNQNTLEELEKLGYKLYQYLPGPKALTIFNLQEVSDPYLLNLVAVKPDKAKELNQRDSLFSGDLTVPEPEQGTWRTHLASLPWGQTLIPHWQQLPNNESVQAYLRALDFLCAAMDIKASSAQRMAQTQWATQKLVHLYNCNHIHGSLMLTLAKCFKDLGQRNRAVQVLDKLIDLQHANQNVVFNLPFLLPLDLHNTPIYHSVREWIAARILESLILLQSFSSFSCLRVDYMRALSNNLETNQNIKRTLEFIEKKEQNFLLKKYFKDDGNFIEIDISSDNVPHILQRLDQDIKWWGVALPCTQKKFGTNYKVSCMPMA